MIEFFTTDIPLLQIKNPISPESFFLYNSIIPAKQIEMDVYAHACSVQSFRFEIGKKFFLHEDKRQQQ